MTDTHLLRPDGSPRKVANAAAAQMLFDLQHRDDPQADFIRNLSDLDLDRYAAATFLPGGSVPSAPHLSTCTVDEAEDWLYAVYESEEAWVDDEAAPKLGYQDWIDAGLDDRRCRHHFHARFLRFMTEPEFPFDPPALAPVF